MKMKRIFILLSAAFLLLGCSSLAQLSADSSADASELVNEAVNNGNLCFEVNFIAPSRGPSQPSYDGYKLTIRDGKVDAFLPFFGVNYYPTVYGTGSSGISFDDCPVTIDDSRSRPEKGKYVWRFVAVDDNERVDVTLSFSSNGNGQLVCSPANRSSMTYRGNLTYIVVKAE